MTAERWEQVKAIFHAAVESEPSVRAELLRERCENDEELRSEVESLLASDRDACSIIEHPILEPLAIAEARVVMEVSGASVTRVAIAPCAGQLLKDRYEVERELGRGGMSVVYLARDRQLLSKRVVVKVLLEETSQDSWIRQKFQQEMEALARIDHPGVVGVLDSGFTPEGKQFLVMQHIEGASLRSVIKPGGMKQDRAARIIRQIGQAVEAAHEKGVWHRDLKPENIMLQRLGGEDHIKLIDFGLAGIQNSQFAGERSKVAGSLNYMAPEQFVGQACAASDTYALAVVAYEILTGNLPAPREELRAELPAAVDKSIRKAMSIQPELRQSSVREFSEELYHALRGMKPAHTSDTPASLEIAHVLFIGLVGDSLLPMNQQKEYLGERQQIVRDSAQFRASEAAGDIISWPTGDGIALAFFGDPTAPAQCAFEVAAGLKSKPHLKLRMGIHSGPVYRAADVNANANVAGGGINMAQRVTDCGDAGHILVSKTVADVLLQLSQWSPYLTDLGECTEEHGVSVHVWNLADDKLGNRERPSTLAATTPKRFKMPLAAAVMLATASIAGGSFWFGRGGKNSGSTQDQPSIAVLPFVSMSSEKDQEYFSDGLSEELLDALAKLPGLRVAARTSSFQFRDKTEDARVIGRKLNVTVLLEGSVRKQGNRTKITTQLIKSADGFQLWADSFDREVTDIFAVQEEIARAVTEKLKVKLMGPKTAPPKSMNPQAYDAFLQGRYFLERRSRENLAKALEYFEQATSLDPSYARAWVGVAESRNGQAGNGDIDSMEGYRLARVAVQRALTLDDDLAEAHAAMAWIQQFADRDWAGADVSFNRARALDPGNAVVLSHAAILARILGHLDEAMALDRQALQRDPLRPGGYQNAGVTLYYAGRDDEAAATFKKVLELFPGAEMVHCLLGRVYLAQAQPQEALAEMEKEKHSALRLFGLTLAYHALGRKKESDAGLTSFMTQFPGAVYQIAEMYAFRGETDQAFEYLERAKNEQMKGDPLLKGLEPARKDHNAGGKSSWMQGFFDRPSPPLWKAIGE